jgi:KaiC/GvpD/RAD55 family RecA-like ATPase
MDSPKKQRLMIEYLISSPDTFALCQSIIKAEYFNPMYRGCVDYILKYNNKYNALPSPAQIEAETDVEFNLTAITRDQIAECTEEVEKFCQERALASAVERAARLLGSPDSAGEIDKLIKEAVAVSLVKDLGVEYFNNPLPRLLKYTENPLRISTLWRDLDEMLGGGLAPGELLLVSANSGGGKSIALGNFGVNMILQDKKVLYISLELSEQMIEERFNTMFTGISTVGWDKHIDEIVDVIEGIGEATTGHLTIKRMNSGTNSNQIRAYLKEYELKYGFIPEVLIVDYLDKMAPNERISSDNISQKDKLSAEQLTDILNDYKMIGVTASQQNRDAITTTDLNQGHIAGGLTKINAVDWYFSIIFNQQMKAAGLMVWQCLKARSSSAVGKKLGFEWDNDWLRMKNAATKFECDEDGVIIDKVAAVRSKSISTLFDNNTV